MAIDKNGAEIILLDTQPLHLTALGSNTDVYITIQYAEVQDSADHYTSGGVDNYIRITERPSLQTPKNTPANDGSVIVLAKAHLDANGHHRQPGYLSAKNGQQ